MKKTDPNSVEFTTEELGLLILFAGTTDPDTLTGTDPEVLSVIYKCKSMVDVKEVEETYSQTRTSAVMGRPFHIRIDTADLREVRP